RRGVERTTTNGAPRAPRRVAAEAVEQAVLRPVNTTPGHPEPPPPQESPGPFTRRHASASYRSLVIPSGEFPALCAAGRRGAGAPPGRGAATQCALQAVAGLGPRRPRRSYE